MLSLRQIKLLFPFGNIAENNTKREINETPSIDIRQRQGEQLSELLFAPDPNTGIPRSDIALVMSADTRPEIAQYIRDNLLRPDPYAKLGSENADVALEMVQGKYESTEKYVERLTQLVENE